VTSVPTTSGPRRIAIVAIHGVAGQKPGETTTAVADMLLGLDVQGRSAIAPASSSVPKDSSDEPRAALYSGFDAVLVHMPLRPLIVPRSESGRRTVAPRPGWKQLVRPFDERRGIVGELHRGTLVVHKSVGVHRGLETELL
jgi:polysaccharide deacetylase 2 family uncharacterized protein YibQ